MFDFEKDPFFSDHKERAEELGFGRPIFGMDFAYPSLWGLEPATPSDRDRRSKALKPADGSDTPDPVNPRDRALDREERHLDRFGNNEQAPFGRGGDSFSDMFNQMNSMMSRFMGDSGLSGRRDGTDPSQSFPDAQIGRRDFPRSFMGSLFDPRGDSHGYSQSSVYSYRSNGDGQDPEVYEAHRSMMTAPGGIKEERKALRDSKRDLEKMSVGRHIKEKGHTVERQRNTRTDKLLQNETLDGLKNEDVDDFRGEWREKTSRLGRFHRGEHNRHLEAGQRQGRDKTQGLPTISHI